MTGLGAPRPASRGAPLALLALAFSLAGRGASAEEAAATASAPTAATAAAPPEPAARLTVPLVHALALMSVMRLSEAYLWPHPFAETSRVSLGLRYHDAFTRPPLWDSSQPWFRADGDRWQINVLGHGLFGSELYLRARTCRLRPWQALLFTGLASATWEYGFEANGVRPSALDLAFTPLAGLALGEARYQAWRATRGLDSGPLRSTLSAVLDPLGDLERALGAPC